MKLLLSVMFLTLTSCRFNKVDKDLEAFVFFKPSGSNLSESAEEINSLGAGGYNREYVFSLLGKNISTLLYSSDLSELKRHKIVSTELDSLFDYINYKMFYGEQLFTEIRHKSEDEKFLYYEAAINDVMTISFRKSKVNKKFYFCSALNQNIYSFQELFVLINGEEASKGSFELIP
jgi:hypothetical protein